MDFICFSIIFVFLFSVLLFVLIQRSDNTERKKTMEVFEKLSLVDVSSEADCLICSISGSQNDHEHCELSEVGNAEDMDDAATSSVGFSGSQIVYKQSELSEVDNAWVMEDVATSFVGGGQKSGLERKKRTCKSNRRRSLTWDSAFFTSAGLLDPEELSGMTSGLIKVEEIHPLWIQDYSSKLTKDKLKSPRGRSRKAGVSDSGVTPKSETPLKSSSSSLSVTSIESAASCSSHSRSSSFSSDSSFKSPLDLRTKTNSRNINPTSHSNYKTPSKASSKSKAKSGKSSPATFIKSASKPTSSISPDSSFDCWSPESSSTSTVSQYSTSSTMSLDSPGKGFSLERYAVQVSGALSYLISTDGARGFKPSALRMPSPRIGFFDAEKPVVQYDHGVRNGMPNCGTRRSQSEYEHFELSEVSNAQDAEDAAFSFTGRDLVLLLSKSFEAETANNTGRCDMRKSLAWDSAFFTSAGLLDLEELSKVNCGLRKNKTHPMCIKEDTEKPARAISLIQGPKPNKVLVNRALWSFKNSNRGLMES